MGYWGDGRILGYLTLKCRIFNCSLHLNMGTRIP